MALAIDSLNGGCECAQTAHTSNATFHIWLLLLLLVLAWHRLFCILRPIYKTYNFGGRLLSAFYESTTIRTEYINEF